MKPIKHQETIDLYFEGFGNPNHPTIVLIPGLGAQSISWTDAFCQQLASKNYYIIRVDNRDIGLSPHPYGDAPIDLQEHFMRLSQGQPLQVPYTLLDMANDIVALLEKLSIAKAHIIGRSMGGMVAQLIAARYPEIVLSLTAIMSSTGNPALPQASSDVMALMMGPKANPLIDQEQFIDQQLAFYRKIAGSKYPFNENYYRLYTLESLQRNYDANSVPRQILALMATGDLRNESRTIQAKTLVIHGMDDILVPKEAGHDIANTVPNATLQIIDGMGHDMPEPLWNEIESMILEHIA
jgi:pimeloyl-ACP methyl ester carboxylesterase